MIITIDGPTASGKSTIAQRLAQKLAYQYINSGLLFRAVAFVLEKEQGNLDDLSFFKKIEHLLGHDDGIVYKYSPYQGAEIYYKSVNITPQLKSPSMDSLASICAINEKLRLLLLSYQQKIANGFNVIIDGRDSGTVVFPDADVKFYLTADLETRAQRWQADQQAKGKSISLAESKKLINARDTRDQQRPLAPLVIPEHATIIDSTHLTTDQTVDACLKVILK